VLDDNGRSDVIFDMNNRLMYPDKGNNSPGCNSLTERQGSKQPHNHFMLGHEWSGSTADQQEFNWQKIR